MQTVCRTVLFSFPALPVFLSASMECLRTSELEIDELLGVVGVPVTAEQKDREEQSRHHKIPHREGAGEDLLVRALSEILCEIREEQDQDSPGEDPEILHPLAQGKKAAAGQDLRIEGGKQIPDGPEGGLHTACTEKDQGKQEQKEGADPGRKSL